MVRGAFLIADLEEGQRLQSLGGAVLTVGVAKDGTTTLTAGKGGTTARIAVGDAAVVCSGPVHIIDTQLIPGPALAGLSPPPSTPPAAKPSRKKPGSPRRRRKAYVRYSVRVYSRGRASVSARGKGRFQVRPYRR